MFILGLGVLCGCQTYDFERVVPLAVAQTTDKTVVASKRLKPNVMLLVDNSGSMLFPINAAASGCPAGCGSGAANPCPGTCPTRISEMKNAMGAFLQSSATVARLGLTVYPVKIAGGNSAFCDPSNVIDVDLPAPTANDTGTDTALRAAAQAINAKIQVLEPTGGTPTGSSLQFLGAYPGLNDSTDLRDDFVLLLTDGLPNCNEQNANQVCQCDANLCGGCSGTTACAAQVSACKCTTSTCASTLCARGCLDRDGSIQRVRELKQKGIRTIVVGFGAELGSGDGPDVLNGMAAEGGFPRQCPNGTDAECGSGNTCNTTTLLCAKGFYQAANGAELADALLKISDSLMGDPCVYPLSARPSDPRFLSVIVDGQSQVAGAQTFSYDFGRNEVTFLGDTCNKLKTSSSANPVTVEFRIVEQF
jgi:hypothetical protein